MAPFHLVLAALDANIFHKINLRNSKFPPIVFKIYLLLIYQNFLPNYNSEYSYWNQKCFSDKYFKKIFSYKYYIKDEKWEIIKMVL